MRTDRRLTVYLCVQGVSGQGCVSGQGVYVGVYVASGGVSGWVCVCGVCGPLCVYQAPPPRSFPQSHPLPHTPLEDRMTHNLCRFVTVTNYKLIFLTLHNR